ncbi:YggS family pyridoxal phosphate-dependent enzyme [Candidatus Desantisbacteria bacterium CG07_land_8_20_14_0_80_39_15]|uniref:Pyridoxal phosphate homeostasis protein n=1 Tax=Candidatus Desantisbacteria bacterium CG07_land_8_20_14_0_80_39_15 TaxID=1974549 RepID=A0A2M6ZEU6_9BACT|nr:MAG: YggS family pyridoxal phosphate-dependent enzyme [Candidatus Desantisbacteria bacterium CG07_land_8_20_14_0_80_39_15]
MIKENVQKILSELPEGVELEAAAKGRTSDEILEAIEAGVKIIGENYVQESERPFEKIGKRVQWHCIGHLQKNKVKKAVRLFDMIETVDSFELAQEIYRRCQEIEKTMPVLIEINSARESQKSGVFPENAQALVEKISQFKNIKVTGLMTMGSFLENPEDLRPCFRETREIFEKIKSLNLPGVEIKYLSMGMTSSYKVAIQEGANIVRIGTLIFGISQ